MPGVPLQLASFLAELLADHRRDIGTRHGTRALTCWKQAVFALAWFRDRPDIPRLGKGFGISQATAYRYLDEAIEVLAVRAPGLREALEKAGHCLRNLAAVRRSASRWPSRLVPAEQARKAATPSWQRRGLLPMVR
jgi:hypothetical protein